MRMKGEAWRFLRVYARKYTPQRLFDEIDSEFVEREATPRQLMKISIQLHLAGLNGILLLGTCSSDN
jgi:hypothetical protein